MSYRDLYDFVQTQQIRIKRTIIREKIVELHGNVSVIQTGLDTSVVRGFYISPRNTEHPLRHMFKSPLIIIDRGMNRCWQRFVEFKELMHIFDDPLEATDQGGAFDKLLAEFCGAGAPERSPQMTSEIKAFWMAISLVCPEDKRLAFEAQRTNGVTDDYSIALALRIPEQYIPSLFHPNYKSLIDQLLREKA